jgi:hypothetical protein
MGYRDKCLAQKLNVCVGCGESENLEVHHVDGNRSNNELSNLIPLCQDCHHILHHETVDEGVLQSLKERLPDSKVGKSEGMIVIEIALPLGVFTYARQTQYEKQTNKDRIRELIDSGIEWEERGSDVL